MAARLTSVMECSNYQASHGMQTEVMPTCQCRFGPTPRTRQSQVMGPLRHCTPSYGQRRSA